MKPTTPRWIKRSKRLARAIEFDGPIAVVEGNDVVALFSDAHVIIRRCHSSYAAQLALADIREWSRMPR